MPAFLITLIPWIQMAVSLGQEISPLVKAARAFITSLFNDGVITAEQQNALFARLDELERQDAAGELNAWWKVEPDPPTNEPGA